MAQTCTVHVCIIFCQYQYVTRSGKAGLIAHNSRFDFFVTNTKLHEHIIRFHCHNQPGLTGLLMLAAFSNPVANCTSGLGPKWSSGQQVDGCVAVQLRGVG